MRLITVVMRSLSVVVVLEMQFSIRSSIRGVQDPVVEGSVQVQRAQILDQLLRKDCVKHQSDVCPFCPGG